jgi:hypothetical protein
LSFLKGKKMFQTIGLISQAALGPIIAYFGFIKTEQAADPVAPVLNVAPVVNVAPIVNPPVPSLGTPPVDTLHTYNDPLPSSQLTPDFSGYFQIMLGVIAEKLGLTRAGWPQIVAHPANAWARDICPETVRAAYYGGRAGIALTRQYGSSPGVNCVAPGYGPGYKLLSTASGVFPVLYWGV